MTTKDSIQKSDQRLSPRKILRSHGVLVMNGQEPLSFNTLDIGSGGMGVELPRQLSSGQRCHVRFALIFNGRKIEVPALVKVTHCVCGRNGFKAGLQFIEIDEVSAAAIGRFMTG